MFLSEYFFNQYWKTIKKQGGGYLGDLTQKTYQSYLSFCFCSNDLKSLRRITMRLLNSFEQKQKFSVVLVCSLHQVTLNKVKNQGSFSTCGF